jgi:poly-gamma-glutamate synthesis protein (capsule biosynthesis protein)
MKQAVIIGAIVVGLFVVVLLHDGDHSVPTVVFEKLEALADPAPERATLLFGGDVMLGRNVGRLIAARGSDFPFARIATATAALAPDLFIANLEGPITLRDGDTTNTMRFQFDPSVVKTLSDEGFTHLSVANNHAFDQGREGNTDTIGYLAQTDITPIGYRDGTELGTIARESVNGHDVVLIGLDTTIIAHDQEKLAQELAAFPTEAFVVAFLHWGIEYEHLHLPEQEAFAHFLVDHGVDLVIGSHPHVVQDHEDYNDARIYYSLGNFVFDQYWNDDVQTGLLVRVTLDDGSAAFEEIPIKSIHSQPAIAE